MDCWSNFVIYILFFSSPIFSLPWADSTTWSFRRPKILVKGSVSAWLWMKTILTFLYWPILKIVLWGRKMMGSTSIGGQIRGALTSLGKVCFNYNYFTNSSQMFSFKKKDRKLSTFLKMPKSLCRQSLLSLSFIFLDSSWLMERTISWLKWTKTICHTTLHRWNIE